MELSQLQNAMHRYTDAAQSVFDLFSLLRHVDIEIVKQIVHAQIDEMELPTAIAAHHCSLSINDVLSTDLIQHILSFEDFNRYRTVCRQWNRLNTLNEEHFHRALQQSVAQRFPEIAESGNFWILNQRFFSKSRMSAVEKRAGYRGMVHSIEEVLDQNSLVFIPRRILVDKRLVLRPKACTNRLIFVGRGRSSIHFMGGMEISSTLYFENLGISLSGPTWRIMESGKLVFRSCDMESTRGVINSAGGSLQIEKCTFSGSSGKTALSINTYSDVVTVKNCFFKGFDKFICFGRNYPWNEEEKQREKQRGSKSETVRATITGNVFHRVKPHCARDYGFSDAIVERTYRDQGLLVKRSSRCIIHGNSFISDEAKPPDPNVVTHCHAEKYDHMTFG